MVTMDNLRLIDNFPQNMCRAQSDLNGRVSHWVAQYDSLQEGISHIGHHITESLPTIHILIYIYTYIWICIYFKSCSGVSVSLYIYIYYMILVYHRYTIDLRISRCWKRGVDERVQPLPGSSQEGSEWALKMGYPLKMAIDLTVI